ncbi:uncharacterized protein LOC131932143 [Physella acuta]|uniref:uncharacterized protein LOC131932143 n=1 Tax=Physella acuta TaxID=109671 RepID=UPI0027DBAECF|nr:uncharacterized protein LOC131932143 [Physella acuta]
MDQKLDKAQNIFSLETIQDNLTMETKLVPSENGIQFITNLKAGASRWKSYSTNRRIRKRASKHQAYFKPAEEPGINIDEDRTISGGLGLDETGLNFVDGKVLKKKNSQLIQANTEALIKHFARLGQSTDDKTTIDLEFVYALLEGGADINCTDRYGQTILHEVARSWHIDVAKFVIENGGDVNKGDKYGRTPLHVAAAVDYPEMVNLLIEKKANKEAKTKGEEQTPVFYAAKNDAVQSLKALIKHDCRYKRVVDYKGRTPIHVAAELDRSETARLLLELEAPVFISDNDGTRAITWMINKMAPVAYEGLKQLHLTDRPNRKQYFYLNYLVRDKEKDVDGYVQTPIHIAVGLRQYDLIMHPVFMRLMDVMWIKFGRFWSVVNVCVNFLYIVLWTVIGIVVEYDKRHIYDLPDDVWRIVLFILAGTATFYQIYEEIMEFRRSQHIHNSWEEKRKKDIERDKQYCHPRWPEERKYLDGELGEIEKLKPKYFSDAWNIFDWICYILLLVCMATHIADIISHTELLARAHIRLMSITIIFLWLRLMKNARAFAALGPFIVIVGHILKDCARFLFLYLEFYIPYMAAFWMIFGGTKMAQNSNSTEEVTVSGFTYPAQLLFSMFRLTLVDDYDYDNMKKIDTYMSDLLLGTWFMLSAVLCLNLFIALMSDTFQRVYDNAQANSIMQRAIIILNIWESMRRPSKEKFLAYIYASCKPLVDDYDDDMTQSGEEDIKKVTFQIKEEIENLQEMFRLQFGDPRSQLMDGEMDNKETPGLGSLVSKDNFQAEVDAIREALKRYNTQQLDVTEKLSQDVSYVKTMLMQLLAAESVQKPMTTEKSVTSDKPVTRDPQKQMTPDPEPLADTYREVTPLTKMRRKKKKPKSSLFSPDVESVEESSLMFSFRDKQPLNVVPDQSPALFPNFTNMVEPHAFDVTMSPRKTPKTKKSSEIEVEDGSFTNC